MSDPWKEKRVIGNATLYLGDCLEILPMLEVVDVIMTDPPFSSHTHDNAKSNRDKGHGNVTIDFSAIDFSAISVILTALASKCSRWFVATMDWRHIAEIAKSPPQEWEFVRFGVFVKTNPMPQISADRPANGWDGIVYLHKAGIKKHWNGGGNHGNWSAPVITNGDHPTPKPVGMLQSWVERFTDRGNMILDPFMGSGTTGVACMNLGRKFIGIEIETKYFEIACERIENAQRQERLFE